MTIVFYISGHGFGHASRQIEIINALLAREPTIDIEVRSAAARWLFDLTVRRPIRLRPLECDTGMAQLDSLRLDEAESIRRAAAFHADLQERAHAEARELRQAHAALVVGDVPALAFAAASLAETPAVAISNFTWDWIYEEYSELLGIAPGLVPAIRAAYASSLAGWRLPMWGGFETFPNVLDLPFVARRSPRDPPEVRKALGLPSDRPLVLVSFGGHGLTHVDWNELRRLEGYAIVTTDPPPPRTAGGTDEGAGGNIVHHDVRISRVNIRALYDAGWRYEDLVAAAEVVVTKPGYGIIAECLANDAAMLYTSRGRFREYDVLVSAMQRFLRCQFIEQEDLLAGRWQATLDRLMSQPAPEEHPATNGAEVAAEMILELVN